MLHSKTLYTPIILQRKNQAAAKERLVSVRVAVSAIMAGTATSTLLHEIQQERTKKGNWKVPLNARTFGDSKFMMRT